MLSLNVHLIKIVSQFVVEEPTSSSPNGTEDMYNDRVNTTFDRPEINRRKVSTKGKKNMLLRKFLMYFRLGFIKEYFLISKFTDFFFFLSFSLFKIFKIKNSTALRWLG